jgi:putative ABC transport system permease protein
MMRWILQDVHFACRTLLKNPGFTSVVVLTLALGIGANTVIFSIMNAALLRPLPFHDPDRLVVPAITDLERDSTSYSVSYADYIDWRTETDLFEHVAVFSNRPVSLTGDGPPHRVECISVSDGFFEAMNTLPLLGRVLQTSDQQPDSEVVAVLSHALWQRRYGSDPGIIRTTIAVDGAPVTVVGVLRPRVEWPVFGALWTADRMGADLAQSAIRHDNRMWRSVARLHPQSSVVHTRARMETIAMRVAQEYPEAREGRSATVVPIRNVIVGPQGRRLLWLAMGSTAFLLLIVCANVANLTLSRARARSREMAVRAVLGADRPKLARLLLCESAVLAMWGGLIGLLLAAWGSEFAALFAARSITGLDEIGVDGRVFAFAIGLSLLTAFVFGSAQILQACKPDLRSSLSEAGKPPGFRYGPYRSGSLLGAAQIALSLILLTGAGLMGKSVLRLLEVDPGFRGEGLLTLELSPPAVPSQGGTDLARLYEQILVGLEGAPGIESAAISSILPFDGGGFDLWRSFVGENQPEPPQGADNVAQWIAVSPSFFTTMGIAMRQGRWFTDWDTRQSTPVIIVNESFARRIFSNENPVGKRIRSWRDENILREIVGVVHDVRFSEITDDQRALVFIPYSQCPYRSMRLVIRATGAPIGVVDTVRDRIWSLDADVVISTASTMDQIVSDSNAVSRRYIISTLMGVSAVLALTLALIGVYGVVSASAGRRAHEIGIRMAVGATSRRVLALIIWDGVKLVVIGVGVGLAGAFAVLRVTSSLLYDIAPTDPSTFITASGLLAVAGLVACYIPARRASRVDPMVALRYE